MNDTLGNAVGLSAEHIHALYQDLFKFRSDLIENVINTEIEVDNASTHDSQAFSQISEIRLNASQIDAAVAGDSGGMHSVFDSGATHKITGFDQEGTGVLGSGDAQYVGSSVNTPNPFGEGMGGGK